MADHALLSASGARQWIHCPPSIRLTEGMPEPKRKEADEGTLAHAYAEILLRCYLDGNDGGATAEIAELKKDPLYQKEMGDYVGAYVDTVIERYHEAKVKTADAVLRVEVQLDLSHIIPEGFGTSDVVIIADGVMEIIDLKYGKGIPVSAVGNPQMRLYALGAIEEFSFLYDIKQVKMTIIQPRLDSISSETATVEELKDWAEFVVKPAAKLAWEGKGSFNPHAKTCQWCLAKATCKARGEQEMGALAYELRDPRLFSHEEIGSILPIAASLKKWAGDVENYAFYQLTHGEKILGWKLVEGRSNRKITSPEEAGAVLLKEEGKTETDVYKPRELRGLTDLEKIFGKKNLSVLIGKWIQKPPGKAKMVPETDPRPELNSADKDFEDEEFENYEEE